jgi:2-oxoglutarate ferredoxin oxidoreductase subunit alpha
MSKRMPKIGGLFLQAESEVAAINMVYGAAAAGKRVMTSSSSPGISLKSEGISYICGCDLPCLILNIQRGGPGLGGIQPSQADYNQATKAPGHGDLHALVFAPCTVQEMVNLVFTAFDLADEYRMPAMILADGLLGQMMEPVEFPDTEPKQFEKPWAVTGHNNERPHNVVNSLYLVAEQLEKMVEARFERYREIAEKHTMAETYLAGDADILLVAYGASARIVRSAVNTAREQGIKAGMFRPVTLWPFPQRELNAACANAKSILTVEMSMGQMVEDVKLHTKCRLPVHFFGHTGGVIPTPDEVLTQIKRIAQDSERGVN